jgi:hypothetical protein
MKFNRELLWEIRVEPINTYLKVPYIRFTKTKKAPSLKPHKYHNLNISLNNRKVYWRFVLTTIQKVFFIIFAVAVLSGCMNTPPPDITPIPTSTLTPTPTPSTTPTPTPGKPIKLI